MQRILKFLASPLLMATLLILLAVSSAIATFIENDFGTMAARALVYNSWWFEMIFALLSINLTLSIFRNRLYRIGKFSIFLFHIAFVIIIIGAGVTRYFGIEGMLHIRENAVASAFSSSDTYLEVYLDGNTIKSHKANFTNVSRNKLNSSVSVNDKSLKYSINGFIPHAVESVVEHPEGYPVISILIIDSLGNKAVLLQPEKPFAADYNSIGFVGTGNFTFEVALTDSGAVVRSANIMQVKSMMDNSDLEVSANEWTMLNHQKLYSSNGLSFAFRSYLPKAKIVMSYSRNPAVQGVDALALLVTFNGKVQEIYIPRTEAGSEPVKHSIDGINLGFRYGSKTVDIPFSIKLNDFVLERYPGSNSPSSFTSNVTVIDKEIGLEKPFSIYMNNILNYGGYRFYQSSYDNDEMGTYLSVNKDFTGTLITYIGYFLMILGMIWAMIAPQTRFRKLLSGRALSILVVLFLVATKGASAQTGTSNMIIPDRSLSREFGHILVQDKDGRIEPISTLAGETLRKLNRSNSFRGFSSEQVFLGMSCFPEHWQHVPIIRVANTDLRKMLGIVDGYAAFTNFFNFETGGTYKLSHLVQQAFSVKPALRTPLQKEIVKVDERVNILYMIFSGQLAKIIPIPDHPENKWLSMAEASETADSNLFNPGIKEYSDLIAAVRIKATSKQSNNSSQKIKEFIDFQVNIAKTLTPSTARINAEVMLNRSLIFERLIPFYGSIGFFLLLIVFIQLLTKSTWTKTPYKFMAFLLASGFFLHTLAIALRWYVAGRAPLSNGYESMVYVAWAAMLAGFLFGNRNRVVLPATALLSTLILFVAHLSWMDPEITNLVPVLKSYWLTIHVAVITASYGFLGLGAILGFFNLILLALKNKKNLAILQQQVDEVTTVNELTITIGLYLLTIGSFLGAVWANESWGRYWGWDPKETWAFITILVYTFIIHMRQIPAFRTSFSFNFSAVLGIGSVLMTYFGVNYYLSGLHSYAGGDPVPVPSWIFFAVAAIFSFSFFAWYNNKLVESGEKK